MLAIINRFKTLMHQRKEHGLDQLFQQETVAMIPRIHTILDQHIDSIKTATIESLGSNELAVKRTHYVRNPTNQFFFPPFPPSKRSNLPFSCQVTRRYAEFAAAVSSLLRDFPDAIGAVKLRTKMVTIREEFDLLLKRLARHFKGAKDQLIFLLNNYDLINSVARERNVKNDDSQYFVEEFNRSSDSFGSMLTEEMLSSFSSFILQNTEKSGDQVKLIRKVSPGTNEIIMFFIA